MDFLILALVTRVMTILNWCAHILRMPALANWSIKGEFAFSSFFFVESLPAQSDQKSLKYQSGEEGRKILIVDFETNHLPRPFFYLISINPLFRSSQTSW